MCDRTFAHFSKSENVRCANEKNLKKIDPEKNASKSIFRVNGIGIATEIF